MAYYPDLSPYIYFDCRSEMINIGWLAFDKPYRRGSVRPKTLAKIGELCSAPANRMRGYYKCPWCEEYPIRENYFGDGHLRPLGDAEIHVGSGGDLNIYAAPTLIYHYILRHQYLPPKEFLDAVERLVE